MHRGDFALRRNLPLVKMSSYIHTYIYNIEQLIELALLANAKLLYVHVCVCVCVWRVNQALQSTIPSARVQFKGSRSRIRTSNRRRGFREQWTRLVISGSRQVICVPSPMPEARDPRHSLSLSLLYIYTQYSKTLSATNFSAMCR